MYCLCTLLCSVHTSLLLMTLQMDSDEDSGTKAKVTIKGGAAVDKHYPQVSETGYAHQLICLSGQ